MLTNFDNLVKSLSPNDYQLMAGPDWPSYEQLQSNTDIPQFVIDELISNFSNLKSIYQKTKNFCVLPFYGIEYPIGVECCLMSRRDTIERVKQDMLVGKRAPECSHCWKNEDFGLTSDRIIKNKTFDFYSKKDISVIFAECETKQNSIQHYKIDTSNVCNAACVTCNGESSSLWLSYERQNNVNTHKTWQINSVESLSINYSTAVSIGFRGGEPTLSKTNFSVLEKLVEYNNTDCFISFTTNGSFNLTDYQIELLQKFSNVDFCLSIDGTEKVFEYMRYPLTWNKLLNNIEFCRKHNFMMNVSYTLSSINIYYYNQTIEWFESNGLEYLVNPVNYPRWCRPGALSQSIKKQLIEKNSRASKFLDCHTASDDRDFELMKQEISKQDSWKGISIANYLPEFAELIK